MYTYIDSCICTHACMRYIPHALPIAPHLSLSLTNPAGLQGEILLVNELSGDKLPPPTVVIKSALMPSAPGHRDASFVQQDRGAEALDATRVFVPSDTVQPPAAESHVLTSGVTLKEGTVVKAGPAPPKNALRMTRKEYSTLIEGDSLMPGMSMRKVR